MRRYRLDHLWIVALLGLIAVAAIASYCRVSPAPEVTDSISPTATIQVVVLPTATPPAVTMSPVLPRRSPVVIDLRPDLVPTRSPQASATPTPEPANTPEPTRTPTPLKTMVQRG